MEKVKGCWDTDKDGIPCLILYKKREKISEREVYEYCEEHYIRGKYLIHLVALPSPSYDNVPDALYQPGEEWALYDPDDILPFIQKLANPL